MIARLREAQWLVRLTRAPRPGLPLTITLALLLGYGSGLLLAYGVLPDHVLAPLPRWLLISGGLALAAVGLAWLMLAFRERIQASSGNATEQPDLPAPDVVAAGESGEAAREVAIDTEPASEVTESESLLPSPAAGEPAALRPVPIHHAGPAEAIRQALVARQVEVLLSPLIGFPARPGMIFRALPLLRADDGTALPPTAYLSVAAQSGLLPRLDEGLVQSCLDLVSRVQAAGMQIRIVCPLSGSSVSNQEFHEHVGGVLEEDRPRAEALVLELQRLRIAPIGARGLNDLLDLGPALGLNRVKDSAIDLDLLEGRGFTWLRLGAASDRLQANRGQIEPLLAEIEARGLTLAIDRQGAEPLPPDQALRGWRGEAAVQEATAA